MAIQKQQSDKKLQDFLVMYKSKISNALPSGLVAEKMLSAVNTEIGKNQKLQECSPSSFIGTVLVCSQLGLVPGPLGHVYLIPYKNSSKGVTECKLIIGYRGLLELARRSGQIKKMVVRDVFENDTFEYAYGLVEKCNHIPSESDRGEFRGAYAVVTYQDNTTQFEYMSRSQIDKIRDMSSDYSWWCRNGKRGSTPIWESHYEEMAKKTVIRRMAKYLPLSTESQNIIAIDEAGDYGSQRESLPPVVIEEIESDIEKRSISESLAEKIQMINEKTIEDNKNGD